MATKSVTVKPGNTYSITGTLNLQVSVEIQANSITEAVEKAKALKEENFVDILGEYVDGGVEITGIYKY